MRSILRTERLALREFKLEDLSELATMVADEEQMRFYPGTKTLDEASAWISHNLGLYEAHGFGVWRVEDRATSAFAGYCGFRPLMLDGASETELVWHIKKTFWKQGIATEAAAAVSHAAFRRFAIARLVAMIHPDNVASRRVAENIEMHVEGATTLDGEPVVVYARAIAVRLREVVPSDLPTHFEQQRDPDSSLMAAVPPRDRAAFDEHWAKALADPTGVVRTVLADGDVAGSAVSFLRDGQRQVGYWIAREHWGKGIATAALAQLVRDEPERPLFARVATHNPASRRVLENCGFRFVGEESDDDVRLWVLQLD